MAEHALEAAAAEVADRWTLLIVSALLDGPRRFTDLATVLDGIAPNTLSSRLSSLEANGLLVATPYQDRPERFTYELTAAGRDLRDVVLALTSWSHRHGSGNPLTHDACGTEVELRWYCPECRQPVSVDDHVDHAAWI